MENKKNEIKDIKEAFTRDEIKIILYSISKSQDLAEKIFDEKTEFDKTVTKTIKQYEIYFIVLFIWNIVLTYFLFFK